MRTACLVLMFTFACGGTKEDAPAARATGSAAAPVTGVLQLQVDDAAVGSITAAEVARWPRLDTLLPEPARRLGRWQAIQTRGLRDGTLPAPFETYRDFVPALYPGVGGGISFGLFDPVELGKKGKPAITVDGLTLLNVKLDPSGARGGNDHGGGVAVDPAEVDLLIEAGGAQTHLKGSRLLEIPREAPPGEGEEAKGWTLRTLLATAGIKTFSKLVLHDANGTSLPLEAADLGASAVPYVKLNRQGALRFRLYTKQGDGWQQGADLRGLVRIQVTP